MKIAINGFGRIGRSVFKVAFERKGIDIVAINDITDAPTLAHLLKYDSNYGKYAHKVEATEGAIVVDGRKVAVLSEKDPKQLPWAKMGVDVVIESTGIFRKREHRHLHADGRAGRRERGYHRDLIFSRKRDRCPQRIGVTGRLE